MKIAPYVEKLKASEKFKTFMAENKDAYPAAGFFVIDLENGNNVHQIDYYIPNKNKVAAFTLDSGIVLQEMDLMNSKVPEHLSLQTNIDLDQLEGILEDEMKNRNITDKVNKIIAIIQNIDNKPTWNLNCVLSGLGVLRAHIEDSSKTVLKMDKASILDFVKKMSPEELKKHQEANKQNQNLQTKKSEIKEEIKKLDELESAIEEEKSRLEGLEES